VWCFLYCYAACRYSECRYAGVSWRLFKYISLYNSLLITAVKSLMVQALKLFNRIRQEYSSMKLINLAVKRQ